VSIVVFIAESLNPASVIRASILPALFFANATGFIIVKVLLPVMAFIVLKQVKVIILEMNQAFLLLF
jgi:hypothetical protein